jgi:TP901 family phage tail tape measure protein
VDRNIRIGVDASQAERGAARVTKSLDQIRAAAQRTARGLRTAGQQVTKLGTKLKGLSTQTVNLNSQLRLVGTALAGAVGVGVASAAKFEKTLSEIVGLVGLSKEEVAGFESELLKIGAATGKGPNELAEALFFITSAGARGAEALEILEASAKAATAGLGDTATVADAVTSAVNAYGSEILNAEQATNVLIATVREGKAAADTIAGALGAILPVASELGVTFDQVGAGIAALTRIGLNAFEAGTAIRATLATIAKPTQQANDTLKEFGTSASELRRVVREEGLLAALADLRDRFGDNEDALSRVFPNIRAITGVLALVGKNADQVKTIFKSLEDTTGALDIAFGAAADTNAFKLQQSLAELQATLLEFGQTVLPAVADGFKVITGAIADTIAGARGFGELLASLFSGPVDPGESIAVGLQEVRAAIADIEEESISLFREFDARLKKDNEFAGFRLQVSVNADADEILEDLRRIEQQLLQAEDQYNRATANRLGIGAEFTRQFQEARSEQEALFDTIRQNAQQLEQELQQLELTDTSEANTAQLDALEKERQRLNKALSILNEALEREGTELTGTFREKIAQLIDQNKVLQTVLDSSVAALEEVKDTAAGVSIKIDSERVKRAEKSIADLRGETQLLSDQLKALGESGERGLEIAEDAAVAAKLFADLQGQTSLTEQEVLNLVQAKRDLETAIDEVTAAFDRQKKAQQDIRNLGESVDDLRENVEALRSGGLDELAAVEDVRRASELYKDLGDNASVSYQQVLDLVKAERELKDEAGELERKLKQQKDGFDFIEEIGKQAARNIQDAFADFLYDPFEDGVEGMVRGFADALRRMAANALSAEVFRILSSQFQGIGGGGGGFGGFIGSFLSGFGGPRAEGGPVQPDKTFLVGEEGPELFVPPVEGTVVPANETKELLNQGLSVTAPAPDMPDMGALDVIVPALGELGVAEPDLEALQGGMVDLDARELTAALEMLSSKIGPPRAMGGPVEPGTAFPTGEQGPELFVPSSRGEDAAAQTSAGAPNVNVEAPEVSVPITNVFDPKAIPAAMESTQGTRAILNVISANPDVVRRALS